MGKPRLIILIRHAQSEGNKNKEIHQTVPDHRVKLTPEGRKQAFEAGRKLRGLLRPEDTLHFYTSPYRRTRETTEGILSSLTSNDPEPSPFPRNTITVYEEPRLREQDFGNFQPDAAEMSRMWHERAEYGHFFYRIPNGESAADAYDRVSGFNESLWRSFNDDDFASVCVLVTHGLMTRVFLMKWYHWSVEYFEDLRNINHCEFIVMQLNHQNKKYVLKNQLRTWTQYKLDRTEAQEQHASEAKKVPKPPPRKHWDRRDESPPVRVQRDRQNTADLFREDGSSSMNSIDVALAKAKAAYSAKPLAATALSPIIVESKEESDGSIFSAGSIIEPFPPVVDTVSPVAPVDIVDSPGILDLIMPTTSPARSTHVSPGQRSKRKQKTNSLTQPSPLSSSAYLNALRQGRDGGGSRSGTGSREGSPSSDEEPDAGPLADTVDAPSPPLSAPLPTTQLYSPSSAASADPPRTPPLSAQSPPAPPSDERARQFRPPRSMALALRGRLDEPDDAKTGEAEDEEEDQKRKGPAMADALGDQSDYEEECERKDERLQAKKRTEGAFGESVR